MAARPGSATGAGGREQSARLGRGLPTQGRAPREHRSRSTGPIPEALALFEEARPLLPGTLAAAYLQARGCALPHPDGDLGSWSGTASEWPCRPRSSGARDGCRHRSSR